MSCTQVSYVMRPVLCATVSLINFVYIPGYSNAECYNMFDQFCHTCVHQWMEQCCVLQYVWSIWSNIPVYSSAECYSMFDQFGHNCVYQWTEQCRVLQYVWSIWPTSLDTAVPSATVCLINLVITVYVNGWSSAECYNVFDQLGHTYVHQWMEQCWVLQYVWLVWSYVHGGAMLVGTVCIIIRH
jgi:hypothetical protein